MPMGLLLRRVERGGSARDESGKGPALEERRVFRDY